MKKEGGMKCNNGRKELNLILGYDCGDVIELGPI